MHSHVPLDEAHNDFFGLPSNPLSIYHTGPAWPLPSGPQAQRVPKEARPVCIHAISNVWYELGEKIYTFFDSIDLKWTSIDPVRFAEAEKEPGPLFLWEARPVCIHAISNVWYELGEKIYTFFDSIDLKWTSIDPVRFAEAEKEPGPLFLWVGVLPGTLSPDDAKGPAARCKELLLEYAINDVEIAFRKSIYTRHAGTQLLDHVSSVNPTVDIRAPFTPALGLRIAPKAFPYFEGTSCLYLCEGGESNRVFLLTARHVALPPSEYPNELYHRKDNSMPRHEVIHLGTRAFQDALEAIMDKIGHWEFMVDGYEEELTGLGEHVEGEDPNTTSERQKMMLKLEEARASKASVFEFHRKITSLWSAESQRILGYVVYAPPISVGTGDSKFTEDWALVELNRAKFNWDAFRGNAIHLGTCYPDAEIRAKFKYPPGGLMQLRAIVTYDELRRPTTMQDANGEACFIVVKNGATTGLTLGRATGIESIVREYKNYAIHSTSREIAVYPYSNKDGAFSAPGDSGSVVGDANYGIVGMLTGGAGQTDSTDVTYVSAYAFLNERIKQAFPQSYLFPIRKPTQA
ncbi:hypothetical protein PAXINDRAFT_163961 [Paxillus involutus ATCC 200175]|uniref:Serine protease n=1 Tax=Paxillus involutus ATCC 200175 TaxID=664439 RepID=A0A0C9STF1_PAXIN|nr:hypothetical protein PAXINDRAFT_163961 [Paxillus involutus ATCC 200175]